MFAGLVFLWVIDGRVKKEQALHAFVATMIAWIITEMFKALIPISRPFVSSGTEALTITTPIDPTFPSSHSAVAFALAISLWMHHKRTGTFFVVLATLVAVGRVLANVHYPFDIVVGGVLGTLVAVAFDKVHFFGLLKKK